RSYVDEGIAVASQVRRDAIERVASDGNRTEIGDLALIAYKDTIGRSNIDRRTRQDVDSNIRAASHSLDARIVRVRRRRGTSRRLARGWIVVVADGIRGIAGEESDSGHHHSRQEWRKRVSAAMQT